MERTATNIPPHNVEAEQSVLSAILLDNDAVPRAVEILRAEDFYREAHRQIYAGILTLYDSNQPVDIITLSDILERQKKLAEIGGSAYLADIADKVPTAANIESYARIVRDKSILRQLITESSKIVQQAVEGAAPVHEILDNAERTVFEIAEHQTRTAFHPIRTVIHDAIHTLEKAYENKGFLTGVASGFFELDKMTAGFQKSDLIIIAGRPSMGKTAFCLNVARNAAVEANVPTAIFSLEMSKEQLVTRLLCAEARVNSQNVRTGMTGAEDFPRLAQAADKLSTVPLFIDDTAGLNIFDMRTRSRRLMAEHGLGMIIVDYLQLMSGTRSRNDSREQEVSEISRSLKALAKELQVPVIALSQLNRRLEDRTDKRPLMADLRESGAIEQDADVILFIHREEVYKKDDETVRGKAEVIIGKQRNGPIGNVNLAYLSEYTSFANLSYRQP